MVPGIDPRIDYAFKRLFGSEHNADILISLLTALLARDEAHRIGCNRRSAGCDWGFG